MAPQWWFCVWVARRLGGGGGRPLRSKSDSSAGQRWPTVSAPPEGLGGHSPKQEGRPACGARRKVRADADLSPRQLPAVERICSHHPDRTRRAVAVASGTSGAQFAVSSMFNNPGSEAPFVDDSAVRSHLWVVAGYRVTSIRCLRPGLFGSIARQLFPKTPMVLDGGRAANGVVAVSPKSNCANASQSSHGEPVFGCRRTYNLDRALR